MRGNMNTLKLKHYTAASRFPKTTEKEKKKKSQERSAKTRWSAVKGVGKDRGPLLGSAKKGRAKM